MTAALHRLRPGRSDGGFVAVWFTVLLVVMLGICALAVDIVHGYQVKQHAQNAADAAALGGTVFLPGEPIEAESRAQALAGDNGFSNGSDGVTVSAVQQANPTQLEVSVTKVVETWFAKVLGFDSITVHATATADYDRPVAMGSPANTFGNQPDCSAPCTNVSGAESPQLWFNVAGPDSRKIQGDAILPTRCTDNPDNCSGENSDRDAAGYSYVIRNRGPGGSLTIDVFDPAFVHVGDRCGPDDGGSNLQQLHDNLSGTGWPDFERYQSGANEQWCTGDQYFDYGSPPNPPVPVTSYGVFYDPGTPWTSDDDVAQEGCDHTFAGFEGDLAARFLVEVADPSLEPTVTQYFRKWVTLCTIGSAQEGDYVLRVRTTAGSGHNRGAIRAARNGSLASADVSVSARGRMAIYANASGANTIFYLARVMPGAAGRSLAIKFFDTGDAAQAGTITILPPTDASVQGVGALMSFEGCTYTAPPGPSTGPPWGTATPTAPGCSVSGVHSSTWDGQWVEWNVPIPPGYSCAYTTPTGCWVRIRFQYPGGISVYDTTTWTASIGGNPVRLVE